MTSLPAAFEVATPFLADAANSSYHGGVSLSWGWLPLTIQVVAAVTVLLGIGWRSRHWRGVWLPLAGLVGVAVVGCTYWYVKYQGMGDNPALPIVWLWVGVTGFVVAVAVLGWRTTRWRRRVASLLAVLLCLISCGITLNWSVGYFTTVQMAWNELTAGSLPDQVDHNAVTVMQQTRTVPAHGTVVPVKIPNDVSKFKHRTEFVYLPPAWYSTNPPPRLPTVMMIGGQFNTPADWIRQGDAVNTLDHFASAHGGNAPVLVFVDTGGSFRNDTECVNRPRGNAADHLTRDVMPFMSAQFGVSDDRTNWGIVGFSMGGTCAVDLTVIHPELFRSFVDIAGDLRPASGTKEQTISRLFGGDAAAAAAFDPITVMNNHRGQYLGVTGWFAVSTAQVADNDPLSLSTPGTHSDTSAETDAANTLCALGQAKGISCAVVATPGLHKWQFAQEVFASTLPWLAGEIDTPAIARSPLPVTAAKK
jgi:S-formylglutathione hydrolase FrmB